MMRKLLSSWKLCLLLVLSPHAALQAASTLSNLTQPAQDSSVAIAFNSWQASSFVLAEDAGEYRVNSITLRLRQVIANSSLRFRIVGETAQRPDLTKVRVEFNAPVFTGTTTQEVALAVANSNSGFLHSGQRYWLVASVPELDHDASSPNGLVYWSYSQNSNTDAAPAPGWAFGSQVASAGTNGSNWILDTLTPFTFSLDATKVTAVVPTASVLSNLAQPANDSVVAISYNSWHASSFQLAENGEEYRVNSVTLRLRQVIANSSLRFSIVGESALRPDLAKVVVEFSYPIFNGNSTQAVTLTAATVNAGVLQPGQRYWLVASIPQLDSNTSSPNGLVYWSFSQNSNADATPTAGWAFGSQVATSGVNGSNWALGNDMPFIFSVDASKATAPAGMTLAAWRALNPGGEVDNTTFLASDHDGNGLNGLLDFAFNATMTNLPTIVSDQAPNMALEYIRWSQAPELSWKIQQSTNLEQGSWQTVTGLPATITTLDAQSEKVRVQLPLPTTTARFYRVIVEKL